MSARRATAAGLAVAVAVMLAGVDIALWNSVQRSRQNDTSATQAMRAAEKLVPVLLSYDYKSLARDLARARATTTGAFRTDFDKLIKTVVEPTASQRHVTTGALVAAAGVISSSLDRVAVLVFVTQSSTSSINTTTVATGSRIRVTMVKTGGRWLIAGLDPV